jgi:hypothetical protein
MIPLTEDFNLKKRKMSAEAKSGEWGSWGTTGVSWFHNNSRIRSDVREGALSWCRFQVLFLHPSGPSLCLHQTLHDLQVKLSIDCLTTWNKPMMKGALPIIHVSTCKHHKSTGEWFSLPHKKNSVTISPQGNYTDWATATCRRNFWRQLLWIEGCRVVSAAHLLRSLICFLDRSR